MLPRTETNYIVIHCSATRANQPVTVEDIRHWHVVERGWDDIGYHQVIDRSGKVHTGRPIPATGAHVRSHNHHSVGICLIGGMGEDGEPENNFTSEQMLSLQMLTESLQLRFPGVEVVGHYELDPRKACPSFIVSDWLEGKL